jgi:hypothetical protein
MVAKSPDRGTPKAGHSNPMRTPRVIRRYADAVNLKVGGATYEDIATALGFANRSAARKAVQKGLAESLINAGSDRLRTLELERLERLHFSRWEKALDGDDAAYGLVLRTMRQRAELMGLNAPVKLQHSGDPDHPVVVKVVRVATIEEL